ncbi:hypothetical protein OH77DRAFT_1428980 [Trametes cingulata]|nr:hypothetical protein OH77DRAFT_1428980 [Trametes cingulata]
MAACSAGGLSLRTAARIQHAVHARYTHISGKISFSQIVAAVTHHASSWWICRVRRPRGSRASLLLCWLKLSAVHVQPLTSLHHLLALNIQIVA